MFLFHSHVDLCVISEPFLVACDLSKTVSVM